MPRPGSKKYASSKVPQYTSWTLTLNNYTEEEVMLLGSLILPHEDRVIASIAWSEEVGGKKKVPHLQGFLQTYKKSMQL